MSEVKLFGTWFSPFVKRVEMGLDLKGIKYEFIEVNLKDKSSSDLQLYNPIHKKVPVLLHNGKAIAESMVILEYIDEVWSEGPSILPKNPYDRAMARFWANFITDKCQPPSWKACWSGGMEREAAKEEAENGLKILENEIKGKKFFGGDNIGVVDIVGNYIAFWLRILQREAGIQILTEEKFPNLCKWADEFCNHSFAKKHVPNKEEMAAEFKIGLANGKLY
ncbi:probable glutathione S-transferase [Salvia miltiorrhiza]|uniref:probable glutathione S-transferase n=1 Tax=Salvia miltiorrhiza TaxID=226208 RepID=UPI0025AC7074|nr:probable glutathione S-transferase [Salvia miltiorrhiza]